MKVIIISLAFIFSWTILFSDDFLVSSKIDSVRLTGYYRIQISPEILSYAKRDYSDIRLLNSDGEEVPFIFQEEQPAISITGFKEYTLLENQYLDKNKSSRIVLHNQEKNTISSLILIVRNSDIVKEITLRGSDNRRNWFIIRKSKPVFLGKYNETAEQFEFNFPQSNYEYFELTTSDKQKDPVQIIKIGYYNLDVSQGLYANVPVMDFVQNDSSNKKSYITIHFEQPSELSKLELQVSGPEFYQRHVSIGNFKKFKSKSIFELFGEYEISSAKPSVWETGKLKVSDLVLVIQNQDNKPLKVERVKVLQLNKYLVAKLEKGQSYYVKAGNDQLFMPEYDLKYFSKDIPDSLAALLTQKVSIKKPPKPEEYTETIIKKILWAVIIIGIILLGSLSIRLLKEMNSKP